MKKKLSLYQVESNIEFDINANEQRLIPAHFMKRSLCINVFDQDRYATPVMSLFGNLFVIESILLRADSYGLTMRSLLRREFEVAVVVIVVSTLGCFFLDKVARVSGR